MSTKYFWDENFTRYQLVRSNPGVVYNWLFLPGGPGADSSYYLSLLEELKVPGNYWLIDLPSNGSNNQFTPMGEYDFDKWSDCFLQAINKFDNPILVGHSFGGMLPLLFPQLETVLKGFVIFSSAPSFWLEAAAKRAQQRNLPPLSEYMEAFTNNPTMETFKPALMACVPYYFAKQNLELGRALLDKLPFNYFAPAWWLRKVYETNFNAKWVPQKLPTMIIGGSDDCITPFELFMQDKRFARNNIIMQQIANAGHMPWLEQMAAVQTLFDNYMKRFFA